MSKYEPLWIWIKENKKISFTLSFKEIEDVLGFPIDHSFLTKCPTVVSMVFDVSENTVYWCEQQHWDDVTYYRL